jgi:multidrug resistance efflux pump
LPKLEEIREHAVALQREKLMPPMQFLEQEAKLAMARVSAGKRREQLALAERRFADLAAQAGALKETTLAAPFAGAIWSLSAQSGALVQPHESVLQIVDPRRVWVDAYLPERHAKKFRPGMTVMVRLLDDQHVLNGKVESVRAGVGRIPVGNTTAVAAGEFTRQRIAVRVKLESVNPFPATEFYGVGRSVTLEL